MKMAGRLPMWSAAAEISGFVDSSGEMLTALVFMCRRRPVFELRDAQCVPSHLSQPFASAWQLCSDSDAMSNRGHEYEQRFLFRVLRTLCIIPEAVSCIHLRLHAAERGMKLPSP